MSIEVAIGNRLPAIIRRLERVSRYPKQISNMKIGPQLVCVSSSDA